MGPFPALVEDEIEDENGGAGNSISSTGAADATPAEVLEDEDRVFAIGLMPATPPDQYISAGTTTSQRLAEAFHRNSQADQPVRERIPSYLQDYEDIFAKESFDTLPDQRPWDHAIELVPDADPKGCKVYPLSPNEQKELDVFLQENLATGRIRPSKSPMASPVFFIKKKDGSLRLVQDY